MGFMDLAAVRERAKKSSTEFEDRVKPRWLSIANDGDSVKITPLQELDEGSPNFSKKNGKGLFVLEHSNPDDFKKKAVCTIEEGSCFGCESGWSQKVVLYLNVLVDDGDNDPYVAVWSRGVGRNSVAKSLLDMASDEDFNLSISDKTFKLSRSGKGNDTSYTLAMLKPFTGNAEDYELFELDKVLFRVEPERQKKYYTGDEDVSVSDPRRAVERIGTTVVTANDDW